MLFIITVTITTKISAQPARGRARLFFFIYFINSIYFINFINSIQFRYLRPLKTPAHDDCQRPLPGQVGPGTSHVQRGRCAIVQYMRTTYSHDLARPRRTLQETQASSRQVSKKIKKIKTNPEKRKKSLLDPGRHFPVPYYKIWLL